MTERDKFIGDFVASFMAAYEKSYYPSSQLARTRPGDLAVDAIELGARSWDAYQAALKASQPPPADPAEKRYLILSFRTTASHGDICWWWAPEGKGYSRRVDTAGRYTLEEAQAIQDGAGDEIMVEESLAVAASWQTVAHGIPSYQKMGILREACKAFKWKMPISDDGK